MIKSASFDTPGFLSLVDTCWTSVAFFPSLKRFQRMSLSSSVLTLVRAGFR
jgi:hypothetical protein